MKFALLSHVLPPLCSGQSVVIERMLRDLDPSHYCLISPEQANSANEGSTEWLPGNYYYLSPSFRFERGRRFGLINLRDRVNIRLAIRQRARALTDIIERERCEAIVACTGDVTLLPAAFLASRKARVPFYAYLFDHYSYREWDDPAASFWAKRFEPRLMREAAAVIVPNEMLRDDLRARFQIEAKVIYNPFDITPYEEAVRLRSARPESKSGETRIVYTGAVYEAHYDALRNLMTSIESLRRPGMRLHLYTNTPPESLAALGICGPLVYHPRRAPSEMPRVQTEADILFLPLAFESPYPDLVRTSATTKIGEYLAAERPVLVHAPRDSFVSWYFRKHECGVVVDENDPARLAEGIELILRDAELCRKLISNGLERARADFSISASRARFAQLLGLDGLLRG